MIAVLCDGCAKCFLWVVFFLTNHEMIKLSGYGSWSDPLVSINEGQNEVVKMFFGGKTKCSLMVAVMPYPNGISEFFLIAF